MLLERSGQERLKMGCSMHATAQALVRAAILQRRPNAHPSEVKRLLFLQFYAGDFEPEKRNRIASALGKRNRNGGKKRRLPLSLPNSPIAYSHAVREPGGAYGGKRKSRKKRPPR
jgi:hypothetical protein